LRILALLTDGFGAGGGIARYNQNLMTALSLSDAVSEVVAVPRFGEASSSAPAKISQLPPVSGKAGWVSRALTLAARRPFDVIFCGHFNAAPLAGLIARLTSRPLWLQAHGIEAWEARGCAGRLAVENSTLVTAVSRCTRARLLAWADIDPARVRVLPNTISARMPADTNPGRLVKRHCLEGKRVILTVGRLSPAERYKGHDRIINALPDVAARCPDAIYLVVGSGDDRARLEALARDHGLADRVVFAGHVDESDLPSYFALASVFAMPSTGEGFGIVFLEAAAAGIPVVAGNKDGSIDALADGAIGTLIDPDNKEALVEALVMCLQRRSTGVSGNVLRFAFPNFVSHVDVLVRTLI
jgi:phosphatidylinositol alpha-1,6-mannosyltransferase